MLSPFDQKLHQSGDLTGCWKLAAGRALSLRPRADAVLLVTRGQAWVTLNERLRGYGQESGDHFLQAGQHLPVRAGRHLVIESLDRLPVHFEWAPVAGTARGAHLCRAESVAQPLSDLVHAAALAGSALLRLLVGSCVYLLAGPRRR